MSQYTSHTARARAAAVLLAALVALIASLAISTSAADATPHFAPQATPTTCDQVYGCPTSSTQGQVNPSCSLSANEGAPGASIVATITNVPVGTEVTLLFDGDEVGKKTATADGQGQAAMAALPAAGHLSVAAVVDAATG